MIAHLTGHILRPGVIDVAGVGYEVRYLGAYVVGAEVSLYVTSVWGRDGAPTLYGFDSSEEQDIFSSICKVPGVGAGVALSLLRAHGAKGIVEKVAARDATGLASAPGVGKKTAEKIVALVTGLPEGAVGEAQEPDALVAALVSLGFSETAAATSVSKARDEGIDNEVDLLRRALSLAREL